MMGIMASERGGRVFATDERYALILLFELAAIDQYLVSVSITE